MEWAFARADQIFDVVAQHSAVWVYLTVFLAMLIENLIPPFPGDTVVFVCGVYAAGGDASWTLIYVISVVGTLISTMMLFYFGRSKGRAAFASPKVRWLGTERLGRVEKWYARWGDKVLLLSRWLSGIRALLALFAGVGNVRASRMFLYTLISTLTWNFAVLFLALRLRQDWHKIDMIFKYYGWLILTITALVVLAVIVRKRYLNRRSKSS
jgi:membrane protein DedA with SNARE-associated domain